MAAGKNPPLPAPPGGPTPAALPELAMHGLGLAGAAAGLAHQLRNPLNAIALQLALIGERLAAHAEAAEACAGSLEKARAQVARLDELLAGWLEAADPAPGQGLEAGQLLRAALALFGHEARHRRQALEVAEPPSGLRLRGDPARVTRLWVGLVLRAMEEAPPGAAVRLSAAADGREVAMRVEHARPAPAAALGWIGPAVSAAARALGGRLEEREVQGLSRAELRLPAEAG